MKRKMIAVLLSLGIGLSYLVPAASAEPYPVSTAAATFNMTEYWFNYYWGYGKPSQDFTDRSEFYVDGPNGEQWYVSVVGNKFRIRSKYNLRPTVYSEKLDFPTRNPNGMETVRSTATITPDGKFSDSVWGNTGSIHVVRYSGNYEITTTVSISGWRDNIPPITTATVSPAASLSSLTAASAGWNVTLAAKDDYTGVQSTEYRINGGAWAAYTAPFTIQQESGVILEYRSKDNSGNLEPIRSKQL